jgi:hypothetical protein
MRAVIAVLALVVALAWATRGVEAAKRKPAKKVVPAVATKQTTVALEKLMGVFKWGMSSMAVLNLLEKDIRNEMEPVIRKTADPLAQDKVRRDLMDKLKALKGSLVRFEGKHTPWDVSLVDKEFAHKNDESMIPVWGKKERKFYFFHHDRLWKMYIAFNTELYEGKTFEDFAQVMESRFGPAVRKFTVTLKGDQKMSHLSWPPSPTTTLRAIDNTGFYGNFCLVLSDRNELPSVHAGRKANSPQRSYSDPIVDQVVGKGGGETAQQPAMGSEDSSPGEGDEGATPGNKGKAKGKGRGRKSGGKAVSTDAPPRKKKVDEKNPLDGLDI